MSMKTRRMSPKDKEELEITNEVIIETCLEMRMMNSSERNETETDVEQNCEKEKRMSEEERIKKDDDIENESKYEEESEIVNEIVTAQLLNMRTRASSYTTTLLVLFNYSIP